MSHDPSSSLHPPPSRSTRPRLSRGISSRKPQPPPVPPSLRDHPLLDVVANSSSGASTASSSTGSSSSNTPIAPASRRSSLSTSPRRSTDKIPLPSPTGLWTLPSRPSPPIAGPWSAPTRGEPEPVRDAMGLLDTVPAGSTVSAASPGGYPWHAQGRARAQGYDYTSIQHYSPGYALYPPTDSRRPHLHPHGQPQSTSPSRQRHNHPLHTHSPQPSPPVTPAAA